MTKRNFQRASISPACYVISMVLCVLCSQGIHESHDQDKLLEIKHFSCVFCIHRALMRAMTKTNFQGVTGWISFKGADRVGILTIEQHFLNGTNLVGRYLPDTVTDQGTLQLDEDKIVWLTGGRPHDGRPGSAIKPPVHG